MSTTNAPPTQPAPAAPLVGPMPNAPKTVPFAATTPACPAFVLTYGKSGAGKTTDAVQGFPRALFLAHPGALKMAMPLCGYTPTLVDVPTIIHATHYLGLAAAGGYTAVVVDDFSALADATMQLLQATIKGNNKFAIYDAMREAVLGFRDTVRRCGMHVIVNAWEAEKKINEKGQMIRGGPMLSGKLPEQLPAMCDLVLRLAYDPMRKDYPWSYLVNGRGDYVGKDRDTGTPDPAPPNLAEILRFNGYAIDRLPGMEWAEAVVEDLAVRLCNVGEKDDIAQVEGIYKHLVKQGADVRHARWACRDGYHRAQLRRAAAQRWDCFFPVAGPGGGPPPLQLPAGSSAATPTTPAQAPSAIGAIIGPAT